MNSMIEDVAGTLYVVATPIGNLDDLSPRAREVLAHVDIIAAEDTRRTGRLLSSIGVKRRLIAYHEHNEQARAAELVEQVRQGASLALVSDAGVPLLSDPGLTLVKAARASGVAVVAVPGPSAVTAALSIAGLPTDRFVFEGFLPRRKGALDERLAALQTEPRTMVFFEAVHRLPATVAALIDQFGPDRPAALARELTKLHEQCETAALGELRVRLGNDIPLRGEFVILVGGAPAAAPSADATEAARIFALLSKDFDPKRAVDLTAKITGLPRNAVYRLTRTRKT